MQTPPRPRQRRHPVLALLLTLAWVVPAGPVLTFVLSPLWSWLEAATGLESIGHSGPAGWCFLATWAGLLALAWLAARAARQAGPRP